MLRRHQLAALFSSVAKGNPTSSTVHVPVPLGSDTAPKGKKKPRLQRLRERRGALAKAIAKAMGDSGDEKPGMYVGRRVVNADQLRTWWASVRVDGEPAALDDNPHLTVAYSRVDFPWTDDDACIVLDPSAFVGFTVLGPDKAVVLRIDSPVLASRWKDACASGATWDHDGYEPHVTLFYLGAGYDSTDWRDGAHPALPPFMLALGPELSGPRGSDVFTVDDAPAWYTPTA